MNVNTKDIASLCGVSRGTVDRALNNRPGISPKTKEHILKVASEFGYRPNFVAQSLVKGKTMSIGLVIFDIDNRIFTQIINGIETRARELGYFVYLTLTHKDPQTERSCIDHLIDRKVDGIILLPVNKGRNFEQYLQQLSIPVVTIANRISNRFPNVWIDDAHAIGQAVELIAAKQYKRVIYLSPPLAAAAKRAAIPNLYSPLKRYEGFKAALKKHPALEYDVVTDKQYIPVVERALHGHAGKTAVLCASDIYAIDLLNHFRNKGVRIPGEVGIMGFDNIDILKYITPALTTIDYSARDIGCSVVDTLIAAISGDDIPAETILGHRIVEGESL